MSHDFWERAAQIDPLWAILSDPTKHGRRWDLPSFFETGRREISLLLYQLRQLGHSPRPRRALDFGCGVGRLTQALGATFADVIGVDASPTMIRLANELNRSPGTVRYVLNQSPGLDRFESGLFDFVYSDIVLQHLEPEAAQEFIREFARLLAPGGVTVFQVPSHKRSADEAPAPAHNMAPEAYRASLVLVESPPSRMLARGSATTVVEVRNASAIEWCQRDNGTIRVGNHWRDAAGNMLVQDDGRATLPATVGPGQSFRAVLQITAPIDTALLTCEFDLVHEGLSWFGDRGSPTRQVEVQVVSTNSGPEATLDAASDITGLSSDRLPDIYNLLEPDHGGEIGSFPMHGVLHEIVLDVVRKARGHVFYLEDDERGGPEWKGFRYFVLKEPVS